jgi:uncharacterized membrane protein YesL
VQEQEARQRELREKLERERQQRDRLAEAKIQNVQGLHNPDAIFGPTEEYVERRRPITRLFFSVYDNLGSLIAINVFTWILSFPLVLLLYIALTGGGRTKSGQSGLTTLLPPLLIIGFLIGPPAWAAAAKFCARVVENEMHAIGDYWRDYRHYWLRSIGLAVGQWIVGAILVYATGWYLGQRGPLLFVGIVSLYAFLFWALASMYVWPLFVRGYSWRAILRNAGVLVISAPIRTVGLLIFLVIVSVILLLTGVGGFLLLFALWAMLPNQALVLTRERLEKRAAER